jgi:hypothetical protein
VNRGNAPAELIAAISDPGRLRGLDAKAWQPLLSCARRNGVLAYLASRADMRGVTEDLPPFARDALSSARLSAARIGQLALWELDRVSRVLRPAGISIVALKGVAYLLRGFPHASTRRMSDIDVMVRKELLPDAERALRTAGWIFANANSYDEQYYRTWSHELPPLQFPDACWRWTCTTPFAHQPVACDPTLRRCGRGQNRRGSGAFICCARRTACCTPRSICSSTRTSIRAFERWSICTSSSPHSRSAMGSGDGWSTERAELGLERPLYYALRGLVDVLATPVPGELMKDTSAFGPPAPIAAWMRKTLATVLSPVDPEPWPARHRTKLWLLYVRSHWLRMPAHALVPHLARKALRRTTAPAP